MNDTVREWSLTMQRRQFLKTSLAFSGAAGMTALVSAADKDGPAAIFLAGGPRVWRCRVITPSWRMDVVGWR
jgi:hypothetical protein